MFLSHNFILWAEFSRVGSSQSHEASAAQLVWRIHFQDGSLTWLSSWWELSAGSSCGAVGQGPLPGAGWASLQYYAGFQEPSVPKDPDGGCKSS